MGDRAQSVFKTESVTLAMHTSTKNRVLPPDDSWTLRLHPIRNPTPASKEPNPAPASAVSSSATARSNDPHADHRVREKTALAASDPLWPGKAAVHPASSKRAGTAPVAAPDAAVDRIAIMDATIETAGLDIMCSLSNATSGGVADCTNPGEYSTIHSCNASPECFPILIPMISSGSHAHGFRK